MKIKCLTMLKFLQYKSIRNCAFGEGSSLKGKGFTRQRLKKEIIPFGRSECKDTFQRRPAAFPKPDRMFMERHHPGVCNSKETSRFLSAISNHLECGFKIPSKAIRPDSLSGGHGSANIDVNIGGNIRNGFQTESIQCAIQIILL